ncbi:DUF4352 domain-containing protein [Streptomyces verrucosisporus]|uniref:DUF4352 domain-containing protein n=1 Tax=Streptomyces verrucosisporus TaxID=1695161 RepID=UPI0019D00EEE|nr:DUF4352 domain-containing protein [Streptomyces verrucosisporus]MBN3929051.1 DUF4352 domain-containing protein [Streptomyces verrucosisporus]
MPAQQSRTARKRLIAAAAVAVLAAGGMTACGAAEEPTVTKASSGGDTKGQDSKGAEDAEDSEGGKGAEAGQERGDGPLSAGDTASYSSGLKITVSEASSYTPGEYALGHTEGNKAHQITVTLENTGDKKTDIGLIALSARAGENGVEAEQVFDDEIGSGFEGNLLPGKKATARFAFDAPASAGNLDVEVDLLDFTTEPAQWSLKL